MLSLHVKETNNNNNSNNNNKNNNNNNDYENKEFIINDKLLLETILMTIRGETIKYSAYRKRKQTEEKQLEKNIINIEAKITKRLNEITEDEINILEEKKNALSDIRKIKTGVMLRSRCRYEELGEKPSGYFLNLENRNFMDKVITKLIDVKGEEYRNSADILNLQKQYYQDLYKDEINIDNVPINKIVVENSCKLNEEESNSLEGEITYEELANALKI